MKVFLGGVVSVVHVSEPAVQCSCTCDCPTHCATDALRQCERGQQGQGSRDRGHRETRRGGEVVGGPGASLVHRPLCSPFLCSCVQHTPTSSPTALCPVVPLHGSARLSPHPTPLLTQCAIFKVTRTARSPFFHSRSCDTQQSTPLIQLWPTTLLFNRVEGAAHTSIHQHYHHMLRSRAMPAMYRRGREDELPLMQC